MVWSLLYELTRKTLSVRLLRVRGNAAKDIEILALGISRQYCGR